jgi:4-amino-4-deoxy-L-arabinose transferase-like glycosyltransferase
MKKTYTTPIFILFLLGVSIFYKYHEIVLKRPQSVHQWRQSDCASIALNYYQGGMNFFNPETHNLTSDGGTSGKSCTSEIPVLYYSVAVLYKVFGYHDSIYRIFNTLLFFLGLFYLFQIFLYLLKDTYWAIALTLLFFTSPVLVYYGNNYLTNSSSLAFSIVGWYYFIRFYYEKKQKWFYISMAFFLIAAALKVTALFSLFAIAGVYVLEIFGLMSFNGNQRIFNRKIRFSLPIISILIIIGLWIFYASKYLRPYSLRNQQSGSSHIHPGTPLLLL